jgi:hypothetical protein
MNSVERRAYVKAELRRLGVQQDILPSGVVRLANEYGYLMTTDILNLTDSDLRTFAGRQQNLTTCRA